MSATVLGSSKVFISSSVSDGRLALLATSESIIANTILFQCCMLSAAQILVAASCCG